MSPVNTECPRNVSFEWGLTTSYGYTAGGVPPSLSGPNSFSAVLSGLSPNTTYHFRAKAIGDGTAYEADQQVTTLAQTAPGVTTSQATDIGVTVAVLNATLDSLGTSPSTSVSFEYGLTTSYGSTTTARDMCGAGPFSRDLSDLAPGTIYHFRAKAVGGGIAYGWRLLYAHAASRQAL